MGPLTGPLFFLEHHADFVAFAVVRYFIHHHMDEGKGFNTKKISRISDDTLAKQCGRGLALIHMVMDEVTHNSKGNEIRMVLKKK